MHILMTTDAVGGVWTYTQELVTGLVHRGHRVTLVSFGKFPSAEQIAWMKPLAGLEYQPTAFRLEWMRDSEPDLQMSAVYLEALAESIQPDLLHLNQYAYGTLASDVPRLVVAHSDVMSWWVSVHDEEPPESAWIAWYRSVVSEGLQHADVVVAPSRFMLDALRKYYVDPACGEVIYNGRTPAFFDPDSQKANFVLSVGRLWDQAKQVSLLTESEHPVPVWIVGDREHPDKTANVCARAAVLPPGVKSCGRQSPEGLRALYASAGVYAATSCYEPFGLAPLEAALSRCALIANDVPSFHELWGDAACYFRRNDSASLAEAIRTMAANPALRREYADRAHERAREMFDAGRMVEGYERLYCELVGREANRTHEAAA